MDNWLPLNVTSNNQSINRILPYRFHQYVLTDWLKFVAAVTYLY